jgi:hypothetical protein
LKPDEIDRAIDGAEQKRAAENPENGRRHPWIDTIWKDSTDEVHGCVSLRFLLRSFPLLRCTALSKQFQLLVEGRCYSGLVAALAMNSIFLAQAGHE